ncbi:MULTISPECIES: P-loop NTPase fold protein [Pseudomonas]|uniref:P-loop NTPase fold protein n=1 Tax=Pseudomonas TaxID=286 RepID=UPI0008635AEB|nr:MULTISPECIES: P-loop NTPase fold protein [Pseudomonas]
MKNTIAELLAVAKKIDFENVNEAETRLKLIDKVLFEILGWTHNDVQVEERVSEDGSTTYADYVIRTASTAFVVEAKKYGVVFKTQAKDRRLKLSRANVQGDLEEAVFQARDYCRKLGVQFAVVTNGNQWVIFPANRIDQVTFHNSYALVFNSIESILVSDYSEFMDILSRNAVVNSSLENLLLGYTQDQIESRRLRNYFQSPRSENRNSIYPLIETAISTSFSDTIVEMDPELFERCYVNSPEKIKFDRRINMHISKSQHLFSSQPARPMQKKDAGFLKDRIQKLQSQAKPLAIVILGSVGAGKTTFLHYTRNVTAAHVFAKSPGKAYPHWVPVNFLKYTNDKLPVDYIYESIKDYLLDDPFFSDFKLCVEKAYSKEIEAIRKGPAFLIAQKQDQFDQLITKKLTDDYEAIKPYVDKLMAYAASQAPVFLVIDNIDQLDEKLQSSIFTEAVAFSSKLRLNLVIALRSSTYVEHRNSAAFNAFDFDPILIEPPKIEAVLSKRFFLATNLISGQTGDFISENGMKVHVSDLAVLIDLIQSSVLGTDVGTLLEVLASGDVRNALRMTREFIEHGYSNPGKAYNTHKSGGKYTLPKHEALRAILLGNQSVYDESYSAIGNPYDAHLERTTLQMTRLFVLSALVQYSSDASFQYLDGIEINKSLRSVGIGDNVALKVLSDLCRFRFCYTGGHGAPDFKSSYYPSRLGGYIVRDLLSNFMFVENIMMDTFVADERVWERLNALGRDISNSYHSRTVRVCYRIERVKVFHAYMVELYSVLCEEAIKRALPKEWHVNVLREVYPALEVNMRNALESAERNYGPLPTTMQRPV